MDYVYEINGVQRLLDSDIRLSHTTSGIAVARFNIYSLLDFPSFALLQLPILRSRRFAQGSMQRKLVLSKY